ncbi:hypothetical protein ACFRCG_47875 [Embleya sp. NPDC056575]|uniref:hypothetical protein n=1 Tax=unclassified Embleya TaxID=2699296 RepID=UPI0036A52ED3
MTGVRRRIGGLVVAALVLGVTLTGCGGSDGGDNGSKPAGSRVTPADAPSDMASTVAEAEKAADRADQDATAAEDPPG